MDHGNVKILAYAQGDIQNTIQGNPSHLLGERLFFTIENGPTLLMNVIPRLDSALLRNRPEKPEPNSDNVDKK